MMLDMARWFGRRRSDGVEAEIRFVREGSPPPRVVADEPEKTVVSLDCCRIRFHDLRDAPVAPSLDREGFTLLRHRSKVTDFGDRDQHASYCGELTELVREVTGSPFVFVSPMLVLRSREPVQRDGVIADRVADVVHSDRTDRSVWTEAQWALEQYGVDRPPGGRLVSYNLWRAVTPPPQDFPLALCDLRTVRAERLVRGVSAGNAVNRGQELEFYLSLYDPEQRWCYFSNLTRDEVLMFQQYDTAASGPSGCLHTAFRDPSCAAPRASRISVEARAYVFFPS